MGNNNCSEDNLRDYVAEVNIPSNLSKITSNMVLANFGGNLIPCMILRQSNIIKNGYRVHLFHLQEELDISSKMILGNLKALMHCEVSFLDDEGNVSTGHVRGTDWRGNQSGGPLNFFVCRKDTKDYVWVSFPFIFLDKMQAGIFFS